MFTSAPCLLPAARLRAAGVLKLLWSAALYPPSLRDALNISLCVSDTEEDFILLVSLPFLVLCVNVMVLNTQTLVLCDAVPIRCTVTFACPR